MFVLAAVAVTQTDTNRVALLQKIQLQSWIFKSTSAATATANAANTNNFY